MPMKLMKAFKPNWQKTTAAVILGYVLGWVAGPSIYWLSSCTTGGSNCAAYSPTWIAIAYAFSWPILLLKSIFGGHINIDTFNPFGAGPGILSVWLYYYLLACLPGFFRKANRNSLAP